MIKPYETDEERQSRIYPVILSEYNPAWPVWYAEEKANLERLIGTDNIVRILHIGSTAAPGLTAKPTVDIILEIDVTADLDKLTAALSPPEYICLRGSGLTIPTPPPHMMFIKGYLPDGFDEKVYHIHVRYPNDSDTRDKLLFRDYLIAHPESAAEYAELKRMLFKDYEHNRDGYTEAKGAFIKEILERRYSELNLQNGLKPAAPTIQHKKRNNVRIIELPACKMVSSGPANGGDAFAPGGNMERFHKWFTEYDKRRTDRFYQRDFMWSPAGGGFQWGYAVDGVPNEVDGLDVIDFPGGLYAVAVSVDADGADHDRVYNGILEWVNNSGCFELDENDTRRSLGNITSPLITKDVMGYQQMDLYFPIRIKEA
jgi:GrpB-like predicted nucleotidyltransferase (UPF0157 family)